MKKFIEILFFGLMFFTGIYYLYFLYNSYNETFIFDGDILITLILLFIFFFSITFSFNFRKYKNSKKKICFSHISIGFLLIFFAIILNAYLWYRDSSEVILQANYDGDINGSAFEFRKDGTYKFYNYSILGGSVFRGEYLLKDSIITLDKTEIDNVVKTNQLAIRDMLGNINERKMKIIQIDKNHNRIDKSQFDFIINIDKR